MKNLIIARHGEYEYKEESPRLSKTGAKQIEMLSVPIKKILDGQKAHIISSPAPRTLDTSNILIAKLGTSTTFEESPYLWTGGDTKVYPNYGFDMDSGKGAENTLMEMIEERTNKAENMIIVSHYEVVNSFPKYFLSNKLTKPDIKGLPMRLREGHAVHFDLQKKTFQILP